MCHMHIESLFIFIYPNKRNIIFWYIFFLNCFYASRPNEDQKKKLNLLTKNLSQGPILWHFQHIFFLLSFCCFYGFSHILVGYWCCCYLFICLFQEFAFIACKSMLVKWHLTVRSLIMAIF